MPFQITDYPEAFAHPLRASSLSAWLEHLPVAPILVKILRPRLLVELGTHVGDSYLGFCQAVRVLGTPTQCRAIDTWQGDVHTGPYGPEILRDLKAQHDPIFGGFSRLLQSTFDAAAPGFAAGSVDLLHIDGMHTYEAVRHDYENWLPKMSPRGVILFHDTAERTGDFGVWKLWEEISGGGGKPSAQLPYGHGLGILCVGPEVPAEMLAFVEALNTNPGLVKILEALGANVLLLSRFANAMGYQYQCQMLVNEWRARTGQPPAAPAMDFQTAVANSDPFGQGVVGGVRQLAQDGLNLAAELMRLRGAKP